MSCCISWDASKADAPIVLLLGVGAVFDDKGTVFTLAHMPAKLLGLKEGEEVG